MTATPAWRDLETRGFVVIAGFFAESELDVLRRDFEAGPSPAEFDLGYKPLAQAALEVFAARFPAVLPELTAQTSLQIDALLNGMYFSTQHAKKTTFWHQDYDAYYKLSRDHRNYLNFYTPIIKPERDKSNVRVLPFDLLALHAPALFAQLDGGGANFVTQRDGVVVVDNADAKTRDEHALDVALDDLAHTPELGEGDLLVMRGDLVHRTQDRQSLRVAASARFGSSRHGFQAETSLTWFRDGRRA